MNFSVKVVGERCPEIDSHYTDVEIHLESGVSIKERKYFTLNWKVP